MAKKFEELTISDDFMFCVVMQKAQKPNLPKRMRYYQGMMDLNLLNKGEDYTELKKSYVIFVCTFDPFMQGRHIYTFENLCKEDAKLELGDETKKVILNTKGIFNDVSPELKRLLDFIDGKEPQDDFTKELSSEVDVVKKSEKWRRDYMTLQMEYNEKYRQGMEKGEANAKEIMAKRMLADGSLSIGQIADFTGLSIKKVEELVSK